MSPNPDGQYSAIKASISRWMLTFPSKGWMLQQKWYFSWSALDAYLQNSWRKKIHGLCRSRGVKVHWAFVFSFWIKWEVNPATESSCLSFGSFWAFSSCLPLASAPINHSRWRTLNPTMIAENQTSQCFWLFCLGWIERLIDHLSRCLTFSMLYLCSLSLVEWSAGFRGIHGSATSISTF